MSKSKTKPIEISIKQLRSNYRNRMNIARSNHDVAILLMQQDFLRNLPGVGVSKVKRCNGKFTFESYNVKLNAQEIIKPEVINADDVADIASYFPINASSAILISDILKDGYKKVD